MKTTFPQVIPSKFLLFFQFFKTISYTYFFKNLSILVFSIILVLVSFSVSAQTNPPTVLDLNGYINSKIDQGETYIVVPPGKYNVPTFNNSTHLYFQNRDNITIIADGVEMICSSTVQAITMSKCDNFKIKGLTIDYDPLPFTQGEIVAISGDKRTLTIDLIDGYPSSNIGGHIEIYDPVSGELVTTSYYNVSYNVNSTKRVIITKPSNYIASNSHEEIGDIAVMNSNSGVHIPHGVVADQCTNLVLDKVTIYAGTGFGYFELHGSSNKYINCKVERRPLADDIKNRGIRRFRSINLDGFHSKYASVGPSYVGCEVGYNGDDGFAINGDFDVVLGTSGNVLTVAGRAGETPDLNVNETIEIISYTGERLADAQITNIQQGRALNSTERNFLQSQIYYAEASQTYTASNVYNITINRSVSLPMGSVINSANKIGNGFEIRNCKVVSNRSRGLTLKASNGSVTGSTFTNNWGPAINVCPEFTWLEGGSSSNVVISNNTISGCHDAAIAVFSNGGNGNVSPAGAHDNILITGNAISGSTNPAIAVTSTTNLDLQSNSISSPNNSLLLPWIMTAFGRYEDPNREIYLLNTEEVDQIAVEGININPTAITLTSRESIVLQTDIFPSNSTNKDVLWESNDLTVATVSPSGLVMAQSSGTAIVTVRTLDGGYSATCSITVLGGQLGAANVHFVLNEEAGATNLINSGTEADVFANVNLFGGTITPGVTDSEGRKAVRINCDYNGRIELKKGGSDYSGVTGTAARTYSFWLKQNASEFAAVLYNGSTGSGALINLQINGEKVRLTDDQGNFIYTSEFLNAGQWNHVALVIPENAKFQDVQFYINSAASSQTYEGNNVAINTGIGVFLVGTKLNGYMSDLRYYSTALTSNEIQSLYDSNINQNTLETFTLTVNNGTGTDDFANGSSVAISADAAPEGQEFSEWTVTGPATIANANAINTIVTTGASASIVTATYTDILYTLTVNSGLGDGDFANGSSVAISADTAPEGQEFSEWTVTGPATIENANAINTIVTTGASASIVTATYTDILYTLTVNSGLGDGDFANGSSVAISADIAPEEQEFSEWKVTGPATIENANAINAIVTTGASASIVTATYTDILYTLTVNSGLGGGDFANGSSVAISADAAPEGQEFSEWTLTGPATIENANAINAIVTTGVSASIVTATYTDILYTLTVNSGLGDGDFANGSSVAISADSAPEGQEFSEWKVTGLATIENANAINAIVTTGASASIVTATYTDILYTLTVNSGLGDGDFANGSSVAISADAAPEGQEFSEWTVTGPATIENANAINTIVTTGVGISTVTATYTDIFYTLVVDSGSGDGDYAEKSLVNVVADAAPEGQEFSGWIVMGSATIENPNAINAIITLGAGASTMIATYTDILYTLTVNSGSGDSEYANGSSVNVVADAAPEGQEFSGWIVTGSATIENANAINTIVTTGTSASIVTATFTDILYTLTVNSGLGDGDFANGSSVDISADTAPEGQEFSGWIVTGPATIANANTINTIVTTGTGISIVTATYTDIFYTLVVDSGSGDGDYAEKSLVNVVADAAPEGQEFSGWIVTGSATIENANTINTMVTTGSGASSVTATYADILYTLTVNSGSGESVPSITIYPNPVKGVFFKVKIEDYNQVSKLKLFDMMGRLAYVNPNVNQFETTISVSDYNAGVYFLNVQGDGWTVTRKIIIE